MRGSIFELESESEGDNEEATRKRITFFSPHFHTKKMKPETKTLSPFSLLPSPFSVSTSSSARARSGCSSRDSTRSRTSPAQVKAVCFASLFHFFFLFLFLWLFFATRFSLFFSLSQTLPSRPRPFFKNLDQAAPPSWDGSTSRPLRSPSATRKGGLSWRRRKW